MTTFFRISIFGGEVGVALLPHKFLIFVKKTTKSIKEMEKWPNWIQKPDIQIPRLAKSTLYDWFSHKPIVRCLACKAEMKSILNVGQIHIDSGAAAEFFFIIFRTCFDDNSCCCCNCSPFLMRSPHSQTTTTIVRCSGKLWPEFGHSFMLITCTLDWSNDLNLPT